VFRERIARARDAMMRGEGLATPLNSTDLFPSSIRQMFRVGEDTGSLDKQLETAADYLDRELDYKIKRFTSLFEPVVVIIVGVLVGFVAIALVSAMYGVYNQVNLPK
jgi:type IV pilus assembly protein PilC